MSETQTNANARWSDYTHLIFIEVRELEIWKENRPNTHYLEFGEKYDLSIQ